MAGVASLKLKVPYYNNESLQVDDHDTNDIVKCIKKYHKIHGPAYDQISEEFWKGDARSTAENLFDFLKKNVRYDTEPEDYQTVKSPGAILAHGHGDCKHYASFITGIVDSLNRKGYAIKSKYRFVSDDPTKDIHHVFAVVKGKSGEYWDDPVLDYFNERPKFYNVKDADMIGALYHISGTSVGEVQQVFNSPEKIMRLLNSKGLSPCHFKSPDQLFRYLHHHHKHPGQANPFHPMMMHPQQSLPPVSGSNTSMLAGSLNVLAGDLMIGARKQHHKNFLKALAHGVESNVKNVEKGVVKDINKVKTLALKVSLAAARNPFLGLVDLNAFNMAHHLRDTLLGPKRNQLLSTWRSIGGNTAGLINAINNGYREYKKHHGGYLESRDRVSGRIGITEAAMLALASGIIALLGQYMKSTDAEKAAMAAKAQQGINTIAKNAATGMDTANSDGSGGKHKKGGADPSAGSGSAADDPYDAMVAAGNQGSMQVSTGVDASGNPQVTVHSVDHPDLPTGGGPQDNSGHQDPDNVPGGAPLADGLGPTDAESPAATAMTVSKPEKTGKKDKASSMDLKGDLAKVEKFAVDHKGALIVTGIALVALSNKKLRKKMGF